MIKVGIVGLGLIGASILKGLSLKKDYNLFCVTKSSVNQAKSYCENVSEDIKILVDCDIVFVCSRIDETIKKLDELNMILPEKTIVCDVSSIKKDLLEKKYNFDFILTHPMAGKEGFGFDVSQPDLFVGAKWLIEKENDFLIKIIKDLGAIPLKINMKKHDDLTAQISHLPAILATLLFIQSEDEAKQIASSGFRDMTRLAMTQENLINSMFEYNVENMEVILKKIIKDFESLKNMNSDERISLFKKASEEREKMYDEDGKNIFKI